MRTCLPALRVEDRRLRLVQHDIRGPTTESRDRLTECSVQSVAVDIALRSDACAASPAVSTDPAPVDVQRADTMREHVRRDRPGERFACDDYGLMCGLDASAEPFVDLLEAAASRAACTVAKCSFIQWLRWSGYSRRFSGRLSARFPLM